MPRPVFRFGDLRLDPSARELVRGGEIVSVSPPVFDCLAYLIEHRERAVGRDELIAAVWGRTEIKDDLLAQTLVRARRAVGDTGNEQRAIRTIPRFGYRWIAAVEIDGGAAATNADAGTSTAAAPRAPTEAAAPVEHVAAEPAPAARPSRRRRGLAAAALLLALVGAAALLAIWSDRPRAPRGGAAPRAAASADEVFVVLPVKVADSGREAAWIRLGAMDYIATTLREQAHLRVLPSDAALTLTGARDAAAADSAALQRLAAAAGAAYVVTPHATPTAQGWRLVLDVHHDGHRASYAADGANPLEAAARATSMFLGGLGVPAPSEAASATPAAESAQRIGAALLAGDLGEAHRLIDEVPAALERTPAVRLMIGKVAFRAGHVDEARAIFAPLAADATLPPVERAWAELGLGAIAVRGEDFDAAEREYASAIATLGDPADPYLLGLAYIGRGAADGGRGRAEAALADFGRARAEMERAGNRVSIADIDIDVAQVEANRGRYAEAVATLARAIAALAEFGAQDHLTIALTSQATAELALLDLPAALAASERAWNAGAALENRAIARRAAAVRVRALVASGRLGAAAELIERADPPADGADDAEFAVLRARLALERGDAADAARRAAAAIDRLGAPVAAPGAPADPVELALLALDAAQRRGDRALVQRLLAAAPPARADGARIAAVRTLAEAVALDLGDDAGAGARYADALAAADLSGAPDLVVAAGVAELRYLTARRALDDAMSVLGRLGAYTSSDYAAARAAAAAYRARGERALASASEARAHALAGERDAPAR
ncbi:MAG TPA: transcriptional regulator [Dokdonella sp.]